MSEAGATRWGFQRLSDNWARRIVHRAGIEPGDYVVDVGAGFGALTQHLVDAGAHVLAVEKHPGRADQLRRRFGSRAKVVQVDLADLRLPHHPFRVVANPPFGASATLLRRLVAPGSRLTTADLVLPAQIAARWANGRGAGASRRPASYAARVSLRLPASAFRPAAPMATSVLRLERQGRGPGAPMAPPAPTGVTFEPA